jgi:hypothetical protein
MGLFERVRQLLGVGAETAATKEADPEDLFGMSTAYVTMEAELGYAPAKNAALCFGDVDSTGFRETVTEVRKILDAGEDDTGTVAQFREDEYGYRWIVLDAPDPEALVTSVHFAADTLIAGEYGSRLLAALFAFEATDRAGVPEDQHVYWVYSFRRGTYYPFAPEPGGSERTGTKDADSDPAQERAEAAEQKLAGVLDGELAVEDDRQYWFPLWPDEPGGHPWE